jgi:hypothetical protein
MDQRLLRAIRVRVGHVDSRSADYPRVIRVPFCIIPLVLFAALGAVGCGSSASSTAQAQFVSRAGAVCTRAAQRGHELHAPKGVAATIRFLEDARTLLQQTRRELLTVTPPASSRTAYTGFLTAIGLEALRLSELVHAVRTHDAARYKATAKLMQSNPVNREALALGLGKCAETTQPGGE